MQTTWVRLPENRALAGLEGVDWPLANWWQLRRQGVETPRKLAFFEMDANTFHDALDDSAEGFATSGAGDVTSRPRGAARRLARDLAQMGAFGDEGAFDIPVYDTDAASEHVSLPARPALSLTAPPPDGAVILGVIDDAIGLAHPAFRNGAESRFLSFWQQDARHQPGRGDKAVPFGHMVDQAEIDAALATHEGDAVYTALGLDRGPRHGLQPFVFQSSHGAAVADLLGGCHPGHASADLIDAAPERFPLIGVNLGTRLVADTAGAFMPVAAMFAILHIVQVAEAVQEEAGRKLPLVLNFSFGMAGGGRNGADPIASFLDAAKARWEKVHGTPFVAVLPAGNSFQERGVAALRLDGTERKRLTLRVEPGSRASSLVEIERRADLEASDTGRLRVRVIPPATLGASDSGEADGATDWVLQNGAAASIDRQQPKLAALFFERRPVSPFGTEQTGREIATLALCPTEERDGIGPVLPPGDWGIEIWLDQPEDARGEVEARVLRNDIPDPVLPRGQTARLLDPGNRAFGADFFASESFEDPGSAVRRDRTIAGMASGRSAVIVGALRGGTHPRMAAYSNAGPVTTPKGGGSDGVSLVALADDHPGLRGRACAGLRAGSTQRRSGTSVAAPLVARWIATRLAAGEPCDMAALESFAAPLADVPSRRQGFGVVDLAARRG